MATPDLDAGEPQQGLGEQQVVVQEDLDKEKFYSEFVELMARPTPGAK